jgi:hypothetical protein
MPYPSNIHIHHLKCVYIHNDMQCQSRQCNSDPFPHLFFSYQSDLTSTDPQSCRRMSSMRHGSTSHWRHAIKICVTQRSAVLRGGRKRAGAEYSMHTQASAVLRGGAEHTSSRFSYMGLRLRGGVGVSILQGTRLSP